tara:strand:- start:131 stop:544 length:414 start_codon:yes stop_codon:yes gene_type:complete
VQLCQVTRGSEVVFDLFDEGVSAGSPQPPFGQSAEKVNLNDLLTVNEISTFFCRVSGRSMEPTMRDGDILMVDKSMEPKTNSVVIAAVNGEMTVKRLTEVDGNLTLTADNPKYPSVNVEDFDESMIWGVVTNVIHSL